MVEAVEQRIAFPASGIATPALRHVTGHVGRLGALALVEVDIGVPSGHLALLARFGHTGVGILLHQVVVGGFHQHHPVVIRDVVGDDSVQQSAVAIEVGVCLGGIVICEGAFGLGAGKWRVIRTVVLPNCIDGIITGCILSTGRILGESAALLFTAGFAHAVNGLWKGLHSAGATLTVALYVYAKEQGEFEVAFGIAAILVILALILNLAARFVGAYFKKKRG